MSESEPALLVSRLKPHAVILERHSALAAGLDLHACLEKGERMAIVPGERMLVPTGLAVAIPPGYEGQVRPRSGLALNHGITLPNAPGTIDADYRGELKVILANFGRNTFVIEHGDRIAQLVIAPVAMLAVVELHELPTTDRGSSGFGSTGR